MSMKSIAMPPGESEWEKRQKAIKKALGVAAKKDPTAILKQKTKELDQEAKKEVQMNCEMARTCFHEGIEMYEEGELTFPQFVEDFYRTMKAIAGTPKPKGDAAADPSYAE